MKLNSTNLTGRFLLAIASAMFIMVPLRANIPGQSPGSPSPALPPFGATYDLLSQEWWLWSFMQPVSDNPTFPSSLPPVASTPPCANGQSGNVWFLYGVFLPYTTVTCTVPAGKALFFPIVDTECSSLESFPFHGDTPEQRKACAKAWIDNVSGLAASIDGISVQNLAPLRSRSGDFSFTVPNNNTLVGAGPAWGFSSADGYYILLSPLNPGTHTIHVKATIHFPFDPTLPVVGVIDTTINLTVTP